MGKNLKTLLFGIFLGLNLVASSAHADQPDPNDERSVLDKETFNEEVHPYERSISRAAAGFRASIHDVPSSGALGDLYQIYGEWVMPFQTLGLFSLGGSLGIYALHEPQTTFPYPDYQNFFPGLYLRYQLAFKKYQPVIPTAAIEVNYYRFGLPNNNESATGTVVSPSFGVFINMGWLDPLTAKDAYESINLSRAYLTLEVKPATFNTEFFKFSGTFWTFGVRLEFQ